MRVLIVGVFHNHQPKKSSGDSDELQRAKDALENLLQEAIESRQVEFIGEESKDGVETVAKQLADQHTPTITWVNIDMTDEEALAAGIPDASARNAKRRFLDGDTMTWKECRIPEDEIRESFFADKTKREAGDVASILIVCGHGHVECLRTKFQKLGDQVEVCSGS